MPTLEEIESLFHEVRSLEPSQRQAFLKSQCGDNEALFHRLSVMLKLDSEQHAVLDDLTRASSHAGEDPDGKQTHRATHSNDESSRALPKGAKIDHFEVVRELGRGGMGVVYEAIQNAPIERRVAIKVIRQQTIRSEELEKRFIREKQALSRLQHPNITTILDAGVDLEGHLYFVMELIEGAEITAFADTQQLTIRQRVELMEQVCRAIHHAHQRGVLHLDIKPSNLLVQEIDGRHVPKVIDFGIAEAIQAIETRSSDEPRSPNDSQKMMRGDRPTDTGEQTQSNVATTNAHDSTTKSQSGRRQGAVGTPCYMSPEHLRLVPGQLDVRADVFSLGIALFELAVGTCPLKQEVANRDGWIEMVELIRDCQWDLPEERWQEYTAEKASQLAALRSMRPSEIDRMLNGEYGKIVAKCMEKDPEDRYDSAAALARDLNAFLDSRPLDVMPPTLRYQATKLYERNRLAFSAATLSAAFVFLVSIVATWLAFKNDRLRDLADRRADQLQARETQLADANEGLRNALDRAVAAERDVRSNFEQKRRAAAIERAGSEYVLRQSMLTIDSEQNDRDTRTRSNQIPRLADFDSEVTQIDPSSIPQRLSFGGIPVQISNSSASVSVTTSPLRPQGSTLANGIPTDAYLNALVEVYGGQIEELRAMVAEELAEEFGEQHEIYQDFLKSFDASDRP